MPFYEITLITRSLSKADLAKTLIRAGNTLLDHGAVIEKVESLGHRDLPFKRISKQTKEPIYSSNYFLFYAHLSTDARKTTKSIFRNDLDMFMTNILKMEQYFSILVKELRENQKMGHFTRQMVFKRTEKEWKSIPKSYPIAPPRPYISFISFKILVQRAHALSWNCDGTKIACGSQDRKVSVGSVDSSCRVKCTFVGQGHDDSVDQVAFHHTNANLLASASTDRSVCIWDIRQQKTHTKLSTRGSNLLYEYEFRFYSSTSLKGIYSRVHELRLEGETYSLSWHPRQLILAFASSGDPRDRDSIGVRLFGYTS
uniref:Small ribosomal subunit protein bS6m n=1 Tax=Heterorhabditis bacteriophora TaxID=37862 RepID=A0A1I7WTM6_HETBA